MIYPRMEKLIQKINQLRKTDVSDIVSKRLENFKETRKYKEKIFSELCFCILTANFQAEKSWKIQRELEKDFFVLEEKRLAIKLKQKGHRFWPQRAERIVLARQKFDELYSLLEKKSNEVRDWIIRNIKGLGVKESSHFLRNIGFFDFAIVDFHIVDLLVCEGLIEKPKTISFKKYIEIEELLRKLSRKIKMDLGELDLYLWYIETGKILK